MEKAYGDWVKAGAWEYGSNISSSFTDPIEGAGNALGFRTGNIGADAGREANSYTSVPALVAKVQADAFTFGQGYVETAVGLAEATGADLLGGFIAGLPFPGSGAAGASVAGAGTGAGVGLMVHGGSMVVVGARNGLDNGAALLAMASPGQPPPSAGHLDPKDFAGKTPAEIDALAKEKGLTP